MSMLYDPGYKREIPTINLYFQANLIVQHILGYTMDDVAADDNDDDDEATVPLDRLLAHSRAPTATTTIAPTTVLRRLFGEAAEVPDDSPPTVAPPIDTVPSGAGLLSAFETEEDGK